MTVKDSGHGNHWSLDSSPDHTYLRNRFTQNITKSIFRLFKECQVHDEIEIMADTC